MNTTVKKTLKFTGGVCAALGIMTVGAVVASGSAVKVVAEGLKAAKNTMKQTMQDLKSESEKFESKEENVSATENEIVTFTSSVLEDENTDSIEG